MHIDESFRKLARTQIGFATGGLLCAAVSQTLAPQGLSVFTYTLSGAFFALVLYAGKELARGTRRGVLLSLIAQAAQVVHLNFVGLGVLFFAGPFIEFGASSSAPSHCGSWSGRVPRAERRRGIVAGRAAGRTCWGSFGYGHTAPQHSG